MQNQHFLCITKTTSWVTLMYKRCWLNNTHEMAYNMVYLKDVISLKFGLCKLWDLLPGIIVGYLFSFFHSCWKVFLQLDSCVWYRGIKYQYLYYPLFFFFPFFFQIRDEGDLVCYIWKNKGLTLAHSSFVFIITSFQVFTHSAISLLIVYHFIVL